MVDTTAKELLVPGAVVLLRTPQGEFAVTYGTTQLGATIPPRADTHFRIASNTKTMTAAVIMQFAQEGQAQSRRSGVEVRPGRAQRRQHHHRRTAGDAQRPLQLHERPRISASLDHDPTKVWTPAELLAIAFAHRPTFRPVRPTSTTTPITRCSVSSLKKSMASRWPSQCRTGYSGRWA